MKKILLLSAILVFALSSMLSAQYNPEDLTGIFNVSPYGGVAIPVGYMHNSQMETNLIYDGFHRKLGFDFGASADYFFNPYLGVGVDFMYSMFKAKDFDDKFNVFTVGAHVKLAYNMEGMSVMPYVKAGGGIAIPKWTDYTIFDTELQEDRMINPELKNRPYVEGSVGVMYFVKENISIFLEGGGLLMFMKNSEIRYAEVSTSEWPKNLAFAPIRVGVNIWFGMTE